METVNCKMPRAKWALEKCVMATLAKTISMLRPILVIRISPLKQANVLSVPDVYALAKKFRGHMH